MVSNEIPAEYGALVRAALGGHFALARQLQRKYQELMELNFIEPSPGPVKFILSRLGLIQPVLRLPMLLPSEAAQKKLEGALENLALVSGARV